MFAHVGGGVAVEGLDPFRRDEPLLCAVRLGHGPITGERDNPVTRSADGPR